MKHIYFSIFCLFCLFGNSQEMPIPFASDITSEFPNVRDIAISPNGNEMMFTAQSVMGNLSVIISVTKENNIWNKPQVASFSGMHFDLEPFFSHDGLKLYFVSTRPLNQIETQPKDFDIWYVERANLKAPWSTPKNLGSPINTEHGEFYPSIANNGNFYFTRDDTTKNRKDDIYVSKLLNGTYQEPEALPETINTESYEYNAFIAPDESYLLFGGYNRKDGLGSGDIYISRLTKNGWEQAENLGPNINSDKMDYCPFVKDNTLYFTSKRDHTKVDHKQPLNLETLLREFNKADNGSSRLFKIKTVTFAE
ncbi:TolB family protein [Hanstruepera ponticola]|uniref:TolB family protein n=1 Tax=Hanstruepera ponticola TaxID=2042995 RepID=UPI00177A80F0|nr:PD40 domain-containing protein [Hanstruepera ponticola]